MTERTHIPVSPACGQWETLLADALDGRLRAGDESVFAAHLAACPACAALFDEARRGREWLEFLADEPEAPEGLMEKILARTGPGHKVQPAFAGAGAAVVPAWQRPGWMGQLRRWAEPRLMLTAAMAFFSIALTLNLAGVRLAAIRLSDLRPGALRALVERRVTMASVPLVRYYDHLRFVYEVQSQMRELRNQGEGAEPKQNAPAPAPGESRRNKKDGGSRIDPPQPQSVEPAADPYWVDTSLRTSMKARTFRRLQIGTARAMKRGESWIA